MKSAKRILCAFLAVLTLLTLAAAGSVRPAYAAKTAAELEEEQRKAAQIAALEQKKKEQQEKLKELEKQIAEAKAKKEDVMVTKNLLDQRNQLLLEQIDDTQNQIDDAAAQIARYELLEQEQYELFCQQVRSEEERGSLSYLSVLFKATCMAGLLNRMEFVNEVAEYNKTLIAAIPFENWPAVVIVIGSGLICYAMANFISHTATASLLVPILAAVGSSLEVSENLAPLGGVTTLLIGVAIGSSLGMVLPISTPPNAIAASTGLFEQKDMIKTGLIMGICGLVLGYLMLIVLGSSGLIG